MVGILILALSTLVFSAVQHETIFPISTTETSYTLEDHAYDSTNLSTGVRFSFTAPFDSAYFVTISEKSDGSFNFYSCTDSSFSSCSLLNRLNGATASYKQSFDKLSKGDIKYYKVTDYNNNYTHKAQSFEIVYTTIPYIHATSSLPQCSTTTKSVMAKNADYKKFTGVALSGYRTDGWKITSGTAAVKDSFSNSINVSTTSDLELELQCVAATTYPLTSTFSGFTFDNNSSMVNSNRYGIRTSFKADDSSYYALVTEVPRGYSLYAYADSAFQTASSCQSYSSGTFRKCTFFANPDSSYYFLLNQTNQNYLKDSIYAKIVKAIKVNSDTSGTGSAFIGKNSRSYDSTYIAGDTIPLSASSNAQRFDHWENISGNCTFLDSSIFNTKLVANESCQIKAVFIPEIRYTITDTVKTYTTANDYSFGVNYKSGIRFYFAAKDSGAYVFNFENKAINKFSLLKYTENTYSKNGTTRTGITFSDTLYMKAGDTIFYALKTSNDKDSLNPIDVGYTKIKDFTVSATSSSEHCFADTTINTYDGSIVTITGKSETGYRPNGWKFLKGTRSILDSSAAKIRFKVTSDISLQLNCTTPNLIEIDNRWREYTMNNNLFEQDPSAGIRFRYVAPTTAPYIVKAGNKSFNGTFYNYGIDSTFRRYSSVNINSKYDQFYIEPQTSGESSYFIIKANKAYYDSLVGIRAARALFVQLDTISLHKVAEGDSLNISTSIPTNSRFSHWKIVSGKGAFNDSSETSTYYKPKSDSSKIQAIFKELPIYKLSSSWSTFTYQENGAQTSYGKGIRTSYKAGDSAATFVIQIKDPSRISYRIRYIKDSTFSSQSTSSDFSDTLRRIVLTPTIADSTYYFLFHPTNTSAPFDTLQVRIFQTSKITFDTTGLDTLKILSYFTSTAQTLIPGDSVQIQIKSTSEHRFDHWKVVSGSCKLADSSRATATLYVTGNCRVKPQFTTGTTYKITATPTQYTTARHYYAASPNYGVKFSFMAPDSGSYTFIVSRAENKNITYLRYPSSDLSGTNSAKKQGSAVISETVSMLKGDSAFFLVKNNSNADSLFPFWISYSTTSSKLTILADSNGRVSPSAYNQIFNNAKYGIYAYGNKDYRFDKWSVVSGAAVIDDPKAARTLVSVNGDAEIKASYRESRVITLTRDFKTYNFQKDYYNESNNYHIRFTWTPPDTSTYIISFESVDPLTGILTQYKDSTYSSTKANYALSGSNVYAIKGEANTPLYWSVRDSFAEAPNKDFKARIANRYILQVASSLQGTTIPHGDVKIIPGKDTAITAWAYGGYVFNKWVIDSGNVKIADFKKTKTRFTAIDSFSIVRPTFTLDLTTSPELQISNMDLTNHPSVCAQVSVVDKNTGRAIVGLDSTNFILFQDEQSLPLQATTIQAITGISVALVVDESGSMNNVRQTAAKTALNNFINEMGPYDRAAIVGFHGNGDVRVHQAMTSDTDSLRAGINKLKFDGNTNINEGAYAGVRQIIGETNPTAVIVFSDGEDGSDIIADEVVQLANKNNTTIYTIGLESKSLNPLQNLAIGTGGRYSYAATADSLADLYEDIHGILQSRYVICYDSPDKTLDNGKHEVIITSNMNGKVTADTVTWRESFMPPKITLTQATQDMIGVSQNSGDSIVIGAYISTTASINAAKIYLRQSSIPTKSFQVINMVQVNDSLWNFTIPAADVKGPGIDFYIIAEESTGLLGKTPTIPAPSREPYTIPIDNDVPVVKLANKDCIDTTSGFGKVSFTISDTNGIYESFIYYKDSLEILYYEQNLSYKSSSKKWEVRIPANYFRAGSVEYYVRATDSTGTSVRWPKTLSKHLSACEVEPPDTTSTIKDSIHLVNAESPKSRISRSTGKVGIQITTKSFSSKTDTITASLKCLKSGDSESDIKMVEKSEGEYTNLKTIYKDEFSAKKNNGAISCEALDTLIATYKNPETKKSVSDTAVINDAVDISYQFLEVKEDTDLDSVKTSKKANFRLRVTTTSPKLSKIDTISVKLFTQQGDTLTVNAVETDTNSSIFDYKGAFHFEEDSSFMKDTLLDAVFDFTKTTNRIKIQAQYAKDKTKLSNRDSLIVYSAFIPADSAEIYDKDLDGKADFVRIHFMKPLKENIESIDTVFWPKSGSGSEYRKVKASKIKVEKDSSWVQAKLEKAFNYGITSADSAPVPYLRATKTKSDFSQKVRIADKIGAVPVKAKKHPGKIEVDEFLEVNVEIPPDTLVITLSEEIKRTGKKDAWKKLFRYSTTCKDSVSSPIKVLGDPKIDSSGLVWRLVLADYSIMVGNCIKTAPEADYIDMFGNSLGRGGVSVTGEDGSIYLYEVTPNPSVTGIGTKAEWIPPEGNKFEKVPDTLSTIKVLSIAAYKADIFIYDNQGHFVNRLKEEFGYNGELTDPLRGGAEKREKLSYLYWNQLTENGRKVGTGAYVWRIFFRFNDNHVEERILKTGVKRNAQSED